MTNRTITLTGRPPVKIVSEDWPIIATAADDSWNGGPDPALHQQAVDQSQVDEYSLRVRKHTDGRVIVYGTYSEGHFSTHQGLSHAGQLLDADAAAAAVVAAIEQVGQDLAVPAQLVADCIAALPPEEL